MGALFTASVRAPLTGVVLAVEMTGRGDLTLGLLVASLTAMVVAMLLNSEPIYESLKRRMLAQEDLQKSKGVGVRTGRYPEADRMIASVRELRFPRRFSARTP